MCSMKRKLERLLAYTIFGLGVAMVGSPGTATAQNAGLDDLKTRVERLERENQELRQAQVTAEGNVASPQRPDEKTIESLVDQRINTIEAQKKQQEEAKKQAAAEEGYVVGSDLSAKPVFKEGLFPWIETPNKDFSLHISAWVQWDNVWWNQSPALFTAKGPNAGAAQGVASGDGLGGIGNLEDGTYFRRIRPNFEGTFWENGEYRIIPAFENSQFNMSGLDEVWMGATKLPLLGTVRVGHVKNALGLEADMTASSRCMTFMERSAYSEAIELNQNFVTGLWLSNNYLDQRMTWTAVWFRPDLSSSTGAVFADGLSGVQGRITGLPFYEDEGRHLLHFGVSGGWRNGSLTVANSPLNVIQLQARPELRDNIPPGSAFSNGDSSRMIDTGVIASDRQYLMGLESLYIRGPMSVQAEYGWNWIDNAIGINPTGTTLRPALVPPQNYMFNGGYVQLAYTLTGENRAYDKRGGSLAREYFGKRGPFNNAWAVRDENGNWITNWGAWELAARYSYVNLNDGVGANRIQGGIMDGVSVGLNWYLNNNMSVNFDWAYDNRYDLPTGATAAASTLPGHTNGFGTRVQFQF